MKSTEYLCQHFSRIGARLKARHDDAVRAQRWRAQRQVERGNPVRTWSFQDADE